jgi:hypothetical protein
MRRLATALAIGRVGVELGLLGACVRRDWQAAGWLLSGTCVSIVAVILLGESAEG